MARPRLPPAERVRARLARSLGRELAGGVPDGYQRLGRVLLVRVPPGLWPHRAELGEAWREELGVETVLARAGPIGGELREPSVVRLAGGATVTEVVEHGIRWRFDAARIMFAQGNRVERQRARRLVRPGETVADLFAGIGYFAIPAAVGSRTTRVLAVEKNPLAHGFLVENARLNGVADRLLPLLGDNRVVELPEHAVDRVFLGWLPDATPWVGRSLRLLRRDGGVLHVHRVDDVRVPLAAAAEKVAAEIVASGGRLRGPPSAREVKPYGPGRRHLVVDAVAAPG